MHNRVPKSKYHQVNFKTQTSSNFYNYYGGPSFVIQMGGLNIKDVLLDEVMRTVRNQIEKPLKTLEIDNPIAYNFLSNRHQLCKHDACLIMLYHIQNDFEYELLTVGYNQKIFNQFSILDFGEPECINCQYFLHLFGAKYTTMYYSIYIGVRQSAGAITA